MKLRLGQTIDVVDGPFGTLGDIVVDPRVKTVTHVMVEPMNQHQQARLVPIWMITDEQGTLTIQLDAKHARQLQQAAASEYQYVTEPLDLGDEWDVGTEDILQLPFHEFDAGVWRGDGRALIRYDRIPRGEVEIREQSRVTSSDGHDVGNVIGLVTDDHDDDDVVVGVAVGSGLLTWRHVTLVPIKKIQKVSNDRVVLGVTRHGMKAFPVTDIFDSDRPAMVESARHRVESTAATVVTSARHLLQRARNLIDGGSPHT